MRETIYSDLAIYRRLLSQTKQYWPHLGLLFGLGLLKTPLSLLTPLPLKIVVDHILESQPFPAFLGNMIPQSFLNSPNGLLIAAVILVVIIQLIIYLNSTAIWIHNTYTGEKLVLDLRSKLFRHIQRLSLSYHHVKGTSDSLYRVQYDAPAVRYIIIDGIFPFVTSGVLLISMIYVTARIDLELALVALSIIPILFVLTVICRKRLRNQWSDVKHHESSAMSVIQETLASVRVVMAYGQEDREHNRFLGRSRKGLKGHVQVAYLSALYDLLVGITMAAGTAAVLYLGVIHVQQEILTLGELLIVMTYLSQLYSPLVTISKNITTLQSSLVGARRTLELLDESPDVKEKPHGKRLMRARGHFRFVDVCFSYRKHQPVLKNLNVEIPAGSCVGIIGKTGAGKSTLLSLLVRFYDCGGGRIILDGHDIRDYRLTDLRNQYAFVLQEHILFSATLAENIAYAKPQATEEEIVKAAKAANAHEFIVDLPQGYATQVGEGGMLFSGGQRQRIALARAFLKDAPILILDEPTSAVDPKTESLILDAIKRLLKGRTAFIIAHRESTLKYCDMLMRMESGTLVLLETPAEALPN